MTRTDYIYQFQGLILKKRLALASPTSKYAGQFYYVLTLQKPDQTKQSVQVFKPKLTDSSIWTAIEQGTYSGQYDFFCRNQKGYYYLVNWEPVKPKNPTGSKPKSNHHDLN